MIKCSVESCNSNLISGVQTQISFFDFPHWEDSKRFLRWAEALGKPPEHFKEKDAYICSRHFRQEDLIPEPLPVNLMFEDIKFRLRLTESAVPSQNLFDGNKSLSKLSKTSVDDKFPPFISYSIDVNYSNKETPNNEAHAKDLCNKLSTTEQKINHNSNFASVPEKIVQDNLNATEPEDLTQEEDSRLVIDIPNESEDNKKVHHEPFSNSESDVSPEKEFVCKSCGEKFAWINQLRKHRRKVHGSFRCNICSKLLSHEGSVKTHKMTKHNVNFVFSCQICDEAFVKSREFLKHSKIHKSIERLKCFQCKKKLTTEEELKNKKCGNCFKKFKCYLCGKTFPGEMILTSHMNRKHSKKLSKNIQLLIKCL